MNLNYSKKEEIAKEIFMEFLELTSKKDYLRFRFKRFVTIGKIWIYILIIWISNENPERLEKQIIWRLEKIGST